MCDTSLVSGRLGSPLSLKKVIYDAKSKLTQDSESALCLVTEVSGIKVLIINIANFSKNSTKTEPVIATLLTKEMGWLLCVHVLCLLRLSGVKQQPAQARRRSCHSSTG